MNDVKLNHFDRMAIPPMPDRLLSAEELALLQREPYHMFKPISSVLNKSHPLTTGLVGFYLFNEKDKPTNA